MSFKPLLGLDKMQMSLLGRQELKVFASLDPKVRPEIFGTLAFGVDVVRNYLIGMGSRNCVTIMNMLDLP